MSVDFVLFRNAASMNMCSKCYRDYTKNEADSTKQAKAIRSSLFGDVCTPETSERPIVKEQEKPETVSEVVPPSPVCEEDSCKTAAIAAPSPPPQKHKNRCFSCNKKIGLTGFTCRCGYTFCSEHRYSDKHECAYDYKLAGREVIAKANPKVVASKIDKI